MFLDATLDRNPQLIRAAFELHRGAVIPPNCFVIDADTVAENASRLSQAARRHGLALYFTTKQIGFNPALARRIVAAGIPKAIAVDAREASVLAENHIPIGHVGHLGQIPTQMIAPILALDPEVVTVLSIRKAEQISEVAARSHRVANLLLRVVSDQDWFYAGQEGGFDLADLHRTVAAIQKLPAVQIVGATAFPCLQLDPASQTLVPTHNLHTLLDATRVLRTELGIAVAQVNAPGNTCVGSMELLAHMGATHGEPGHALTGTTYLHAHPNAQEQPAMVYVSEISHMFGSAAYAFGGGIYRRAKTNRALVGSRPGEWQRATVRPLDPTAIDYYMALELPPDSAAQVGDTVIVASRAQVFVSRAYVAVVEGIQAGHPTLLGVYDALGRIVERVF